MATARTRSGSRGGNSAGSSTSKTKTPSLESLTNQLCDNCTTGVLAVVRYDPNAIHEAGQDLSAENQHESGGGYETVCGQCGQRLSHPFGNADGNGEAS